MVFSTPYPSCCVCAEAWELVWFSISGRHFLPETRHTFIQTHMEFSRQHFSGYLQPFCGIVWTVWNLVLCSTVPFLNFIKKQGKWQFLSFHVIEIRPPPPCTTSILTPLQKWKRWWVGYLRVRSSVFGEFLSIAQDEAWEGWPETAQPDGFLSASF